MTEDGTQPLLTLLNFFLRITTAILVNGPSPSKGLPGFTRPITARESPSNDRASVKNGNTTVENIYTWVILPVAVFIE